MMKLISKTRSNSMGRLLLIKITTMKMVLKMIQKVDLISCLKKKRKNSLISNYIRFIDQYRDKNGKKIGRNKGQDIKEVSYYSYNILGIYDWKW